MKLVACGDSWVWGYELVDPTVQKIPIADVEGDPVNIHLLKEHLEYRYKHRYVNLLADRLNAEVVDLSAPGISNWSILRRLMVYLAANNDYHNLFVTIGWTSPVRNEFYIDKTKTYIDYGPWVEYLPYEADLKESLKLYTLNLYSLKKQLEDYFMVVNLTENLLKSCNINYIMHQAFYDNEHWLKEDDGINFNTVGKDHQNIFHMVDDTRFILKYSSLYKALFSENYKKYMFKWHPNELGHKKISDYIFDYCVNKGIL